MGGEGIRREEKRGKEMVKGAEGREGERR